MSLTCAFLFFLLVSFFLLVLVLVLVLLVVLLVVLLGVPFLLLSSPSFSFSTLVLFQLHRKKLKVLWITEVPVPMKLLLFGLVNTWGIL